MTKTDDQTPDTDKTAGDKKSNGRTLTPATRRLKASATSEKKERYAPSGIDENDTYKGTRVRRWEPYQIPVVKSVLNRIGVESADDIDGAVTDDAKRGEVARMLGTCLVCREKKGVVSQLFRKGPNGPKRIEKELEPEEIATAMKAALELSEVDLSKESD